jgi:hypothetical protein
MSGIFQRRMESTVTVTAKDIARKGRSEGGTARFSSGGCWNVTYLFTLTPLTSLISQGFAISASTNIMCILFKKAIAGLILADLSLMELTVTP